jgi:molecular chaperone HtpG
MEKHMTVATGQETLGFQTEVKQLLHLMIHSLYSNKEIFLRELVSNASDALDKRRFMALDDSALQSEQELAIHIDFNEKERTVTVRDNGIGMSREEIIQHLGTIAKSGTKEFLQSLTGDDAKDAKLIGQFGVGFYSSFIVADKVIVNSRKAGTPPEAGVRWESAGEGEYTVAEVTLEQPGTEVILHLRADEDEFLESYRLRSIITKYSDHIGFPIYMRKIEVPSGEDESENKAPTQSEEYEVVNKATALWTVPKNEIKEEEYQEFYKHISHDFEAPMTWSHNRVEGKTQYISLLYIPSHAPFDLWNREQPRGLKLYVQRVFIMDDVEQFLPSYLRFVKGIVDSNDLPLNVSREILQGSKVVDTIRKGCASKVLSMLDSMAKNDVENYQKIWNEFGQVIKEGPGEDFANKEKIAKLLRFASSHKNTSTQDVSLDEYISRMKGGQDKIYYITADNFNAAANSPHLEVFRKKDIEVLLLSDRVDEWLVSHLTEYEGKQLQSIAKGDLDLGDLEDEQTKEAHKKTEEEFTDFIPKVKEVLKDRVEEVKITHRLTDSPACIVASQFGMSAHLQRMMKEAGQFAPEMKPVLELNPTHPLVKRLKSEDNQEKFADWANILLDQAILAEGGHLTEPATFVKRLNSMLMEVALR